MPQDNVVVLQDVKLIFRNFTGREGMYNREGDRNFAVLLPQHIAEDMARSGWNVKQLRPREEGEEPQPYLSITVKYTERSRPNIKMITSRGTTDLDEESVDVLDHVEMKLVDLIIRPYDWNVSGNTGRKAYLQDLYVTIIENPLELKYGNTSAIATVDGPMMEFTTPLVVDSVRDDRRAIEA